MSDRHRRSLTAEAVAEVVVGVSAALAERHPAAGRRVVSDVVYQAATELVVTVTDPNALARILTRRTHARLMATAGAPIALGRAQKLAHVVAITR